MAQCPGSSPWRHSASLGVTRCHSTSLGITALPSPGRRRLGGWRHSGSPAAPAAASSRYVLCDLCTLAVLLVVSDQQKLPRAAQAPAQSCVGACRQQSSCAPAAAGCTHPALPRGRTNPLALAICNTLVWASTLAFCTASPKHTCQDLGPNPPAARLLPKQAGGRAPSGFGLHAATACAPLPSLPRPPPACAGGAGQRPPGALLALSCPSPDALSLLSVQIHKRF